MAITNWITNPSAEVNVTDWAANGGATFSRSTDWASEGSASFKMVCSGSGTRQGMRGNTYYAVTNGSTWTMSVDVHLSGSVKVEFGADVHNASFGWIGNAIELQPTVTNDDRLAATFTINNINAAYIRPYLRTNLATAVTYYADGWLLTDEVGHTDYFDGDTPGGTWTGTPHLSASTWEVVVPTPITVGILE